jgi:pyruvate/2-oxoglutarate/acetoin dehydrogenase E1 component
MRNRTAIGGTTFAQLGTLRPCSRINCFSAGTHEDARNMLHAALQSTDPVILFEYTFLLNMEKKFEEATPVTITEAKVRREGKDRLLLTVLRFINA